MRFYRPVLLFCVIASLGAQVGAATVDKIDSSPSKVVVGEGYVIRSAALRKDGSKNAAFIAELPKGTIFKITKIVKSHAFVTNDDDSTGWIWLPLVRNTKTVSETADSNASLSNWEKPGSIKIEPAVIESTGKAAEKNPVVEEKAIVPLISQQNDVHIRINGAVDEKRVERQIEKHTAAVGAAMAAMPQTGSRFVVSDVVPAAKPDSTPAATPFAAATKQPKTAVARSAEPIVVAEPPAVAPKPVVLAATISAAKPSAPVPALPIKKEASVVTPVPVAPVAASAPLTPAVTEIVPPVPAKAAKPQKTQAAMPSGTVKEQPMPGIGTMPGDKRLLQNNVVRVGGDRSEMFYVSSQFPNRIATPFADPQVIDSSSTQIKTVGQSLYVTTTTEKPVAIFITGTNPNDPVVSLTLVPRPVPSQTITLQMDAPAQAKNAAPDGEEDAPDSYTGQVRMLMRSVALGKSPDGYTESALPKSVVRMGDLMIVPDRRYSGTYMDIYRYRVENVARKTLELAETMFYQDGVRAVGIFPSLKLGAGESTMVFVLADKSGIQDGDR